MKKLICGVLVLSMTLPIVLGGCAKEKKNEEQKSVSKNLNETGLPIAKEKVNLKFAAKSRYNKNFDDLKFFKELEEKTNVHIQWDMSPEDGWKEKKSLMFASNDLPDAFYGQSILDDMDIVKYGNQKMLMPMENILDKYGANVNKVLGLNADYKKQITAPDGHIYSLPTLIEDYPSVFDKLFINKTWLSQLGLNMPETVEDFYKVLKAFKENDMNKNGKADEIPFVFAHNKKENGLYSMFGAFGLVDSIDHVAVKNGKAVFTAIQPEYKEAIKYFNKLFSDGLIDKESFTHDFKVYISKLQSKEPKVGAFMAWSLSSAVGPNNKDYVPLAPLKGTNGKQLWGRYDSKITSRTSFSITSECKEPEIALRWINESFDWKNSLQIGQGMIGVTLKEDPQDKFAFLPIPSGTTSNELIHQASPGVNGIYAITNETWSKVTPNENLKERRELDKFYSPYVTAEIYPNVYYTTEEVEKLAGMQTDILAYAEQMYAKWMINGGIDQEWDGYVKKLKDMKLDDLIKIKQDALTRYNSNK